MGPKNNVGLGGCQTTEYLLPYFNTVNGRIRENGGLQRCWMERFQVLYVHMACYRSGRRIECKINEAAINIIADVKSTLQYCSGYGCTNGPAYINIDVCV